VTKCSLVDRYQRFEARTASKFMAEAWKNKKYVLTQLLMALQLNPVNNATDSCRPTVQKEQQNVKNNPHRGPIHFTLSPLKTKCREFQEHNHGNKSHRSANGGGISQSAFSALTQK